MGTCGSRFFLPYNMVHDTEWPQHRWGAGAPDCSCLLYTSHVEAIITRNQADFERSTIPVCDCAEFFAHLKDAHGLVYEEIDW